MVFLKVLMFISLSCVCRGNFVSKSELPELEYLNRSVDPCDDFYEYACGNFKNVKPRPDRYPLWDNYIILQSQLHHLMEVILQSQQGSNDPIAVKKSKTAYHACLNVDYSDKLNVPELAVLEDSGTWPLIAISSDTDPEFSWNTVGDLIASYGVPLFFNIDVMPNLSNASENIIYVSRDRILNPSIHPPIVDNSEDFLNSKASMKRGVHPFETFLAKVAFELRGLTGSFKPDTFIRREVADILEFMKIIQKGGIKDDNKYNGTSATMTVQELREWMEMEFGQEIKLDWLEYLNHVFGKSGVKVEPNVKVLVMDMSEFYGVLNFIRQNKDNMLKNFVMTRIFTYTAPDSNTKIRDAYNQFRVDMGDMIFSRPEYCVRKVLDYPNGIGLSMAMTHEYKENHFDKNKIKSAAEMIEDLYVAFNDILNESGWLDEETRAQALLKADQMITLLAYPDFIEDPELLDKYYENVRICSWDHFGNSQRVRAFRLASNLALLGKPRDREVWQISPLVTNAYYNAQNNRILFPITMLNSPFFTGRVSAADYGRIGSIIGHEITHGFDNGGMSYDGEGSVSLWWTAQTYAEFLKRTACFQEQYGKYYLKEIDQYVNPTTTLRENIADNGGLREAFKAFQMLKQRDTVQSTEEYTPEQLFFIGFGTMWCTEQTDQYLKNKIQNSAHAPARYRVIGSVSNNMDFAEAFNCPVGSNMNPENKCILW